MASIPIPLCDLRPQHGGLRPEIEAAFRRVLDRSWFILGEEVRRFEAELAAYLGAAYAVGVGSGTEAIHLALRALDVRPGARVLTAPNSAVPTACAIAEAGAVPCFADVDPRTGLLDPARVAEKLDPDVAAIVVVHLYGRCVPLDRILELAGAKGIPVIEDAAQAHGARWKGKRAGTLADLGCFSFYPSKNLGALGDGGAVVSGRPGLEERLRQLRNYGQRDRYRHVTLGFNSRLDELQAALLRVKLPHLDRWNRRRSEIAATYRRRLSGLPLLLPPEEEPEESVHHLFVVRVARRDAVRAGLEQLGVETQVHYPIPIHLQEAFVPLGGKRGDFPVAERRAEQILSLPLFPELTAEQQERVVQALEQVLRGEPHPEEIET